MLNFHLNEMDIFLGFNIHTSKGQIRRQSCANKNAPLLIHASAHLLNIFKLTFSMQKS